MADDSGAGTAHDEAIRPGRIDGRRRSTRTAKLMTTTAAHDSDVFKRPANPAKRSTVAAAAVSNGVLGPMDQPDLNRAKIDSTHDAAAVGNPIEGDVAGEATNDPAIGIEGAHSELS